MKKVYTCFTTSVIHDGHLNIIKEARKYGEVIVGALSDEALIRYNKFPTISLDERLRLYRNIEGVHSVIIQNEMNYDDVIPLVQPDIVIHGDNWTDGPIAALRTHLIELLDAYGGELIEVPYTHSRDVEKVDSLLHDKLSMPEYRRGRFRQLLEMGANVKVMEAHDGISALLAEETVAVIDGNLNQFDAIWISEGCDSITHGKLSMDMVDASSRIRTVDDIISVTTKPILFDGGTGGTPQQFTYLIRLLERMGVSGMVIRDDVYQEKKDAKAAGNEAIGTDEFCAKIRAGKDAVRTDDFLIVARIDSALCKKSSDKAIELARAYVSAGSDGIMLEARQEADADAVLSFIDTFREEDLDTPILVLASDGFKTDKSSEIEEKTNAIIYPNQMTRSAFTAMESAAQVLLKEGIQNNLSESLASEEEIEKFIKLSPFL